MYSSRRASHVKSCQVELHTSKLLHVEPVRHGVRTLSQCGYFFTSPDSPTAESKSPSAEPCGKVFRFPRRTGPAAPTSAVPFSHRRFGAIWRGGHGAGRCGWPDLARQCGTRTSTHALPTHHLAPITRRAPAHAPYCARSTSAPICLYHATSITSICTLRPGQEHTARDVRTDAPNPAQAWAFAPIPALCQVNCTQDHAD